MPMVPCRIKEIGKGCRPVLIINNDERNEYNNSVVILPLTMDDLKNILPVEFYIKNAPETNLDEPSKVLGDSPFAWDKEIRLEKRLGVESNGKGKSSSENCFQ